MASHRLVIGRESDQTRYINGIGALVRVEPGRESELVQRVHNPRIIEHGSLWKELDADD